MENRLLLLVLVLFMVLPGVTMAQPQARPSNEKQRRSIEIGDDVPLYDETGEEIGTARVDGIEMPVTEWTNPSTVELLDRYQVASATVTFAATKGSIRIRPEQFWLISADGQGIQANTTLIREDGKTPLESERIEEGDSLTASMLFWAFKEGIDIPNRLVWFPSGGGAIRLVDTADPVSEGTRIEQFSGYENEMQSYWTLEELTDPFEQVRESSRPEEGYRYVGIAVHIEILRINPNINSNDFLLYDEYGREYRRKSVKRLNAAVAEMPDFENGWKDPYTETTGYIVFEVPEEVAVQTIVYVNDTSWFYIVLYDRD